MRERERERESVCVCADAYVWSYRFVISLVCAGGLSSWLFLCSLPPVVQPECGGDGAESSGPHLKTGVQFEDRDDEQGRLRAPAH